LNKGALGSFFSMDDVGHSPLEADLLARSRDGDTVAFDGLVTCHRNKIFSIIFQIVRNEEDAMDLTQDTFVKAWFSLAKFDGQRPFGAWIHRIATNAALDHFRRRQKRPQCAFDDFPMKIDAASKTTPASSEVPGEVMDRAELRRRLDKAIALLTPDHRAVILLKEVEDLSYSEIADQLRCSLGTVMSRLFYARKHLQSHLSDLYEKN